MSEASKIIAMPPRGKHGKARNYEWWITFDPIARRWSWRVTFTMVSELTGDAATLAEAQHIVDQHVKQVRQ